MNSQQGKRIVPFMGRQSLSENVRALLVSRAVFDAGIETLQHLFDGPKVHVVGAKDVAHLRGGTLLNHLDGGFVVLHNPQMDTAAQQHVPKVHDWDGLREQ